MSLLDRIQRNRMPRPGEEIEVYQHNRLLAAGVVVNIDVETVTIADSSGLIDLDTKELRRGINDGSISIKRPSRR